MTDGAVKVNLIAVLRKSTYWIGVLIDQYCGRLVAIQSTTNMGCLSNELVERGSEFELYHFPEKLKIYFTIIHNVWVDNIYLFKANGKILIEYK